jgi:anti-sigma regulatory factor (Ser/Thr protein kinase)
MPAETGNDSERLSLRLAARPNQAFQLRAQLRVWLVAQRAEEEEILDILLAADEAFTNAVTHVRQPRSIAVQVDASISEGLVEVVVGDYGRWHEDQRCSSSEGLGLPLMQAFMDTVDVRAGLEGTTVKLRRMLGAHPTGVDLPAPAASDGRLQLLGRNPIFAPLPREVLEPVAAQLIPFSASEGETIIREGDQGELFYLIADGELDVRADSRHVATLGPNDHVGEIALIRHIPRTATIVAKKPTQLYALTTQHFLDAVTSSNTRNRLVEPLIRARLTELRDIVGHSA